MPGLTLKVFKTNPNAMLPSYAHPTDACMDLHSAIDCVICPGMTYLVPTGIAIELPPGTEAQIRPRSGIALRHSVTVLNTPGTIDEGYRGTVGVILVNHGKTDFVVSKGMRIAQLAIAPVMRLQVVEVDRMDVTSDRGDRGFGSTGV